jgi:hypothetical protein
MLANYRCSEIRDQVFQEHEPELRELQFSTSKHTVENFKEECLKIYNAILSDFDKTASNYVEKIYHNFRKQIESTLSSKFYICFVNQAKRLIPISQKFYRQDLQRSIKTGGDNFYELAENFKNKYLNALMLKLEEKKVFDFWQIPREEYLDLYDEITENQKRILLDEKRLSISKGLKKEIEEIMFNKLDDFSNKFWIEVNTEYFQFFAVKMFPLKVFLRDFYRMTDQEIAEYANQIESDVYSNIKKDFQKKTKEISSLAVEIFKKKFWYVEGNVQRDWNRIDEEEMDNLFKKYRAELSEIFDTFKFFRLIKHPLKCIF